MKYIKLYITALLVLSNIKHLQADTSWHRNLIGCSQHEYFKDDITIHINEAQAKKEKLIVNVCEQTLYHLDAHNQLIQSYPISTGLKGTGETPNSFKTPRGWHEVASKHGDNLSVDQHFKYRLPSVKPTGITSRILTLKGKQSHNKNSIQRCIYIHGTNKTNGLGKHAKSHGCICMHPEAVKKLHDTIETGTSVYIFDKKNPLPWQHHV